MVVMVVIWSASAHGQTAGNQSPTGESGAAIKHSCLAWLKRSLPPCFPKDVPVRDDFKISVSDGDPHRGAYLIQGRSASDIQALFRFYSQTAVDKGWSHEGYEKLAGNKTVRLSFQKSSRFFTVNLAQIRRGTLVTIETLNKTE